jgi:hypothetical protein
MAQENIRLIGTNTKGSATQTTQTTTTATTPCSSTRRCSVFKRIADFWDNLANPNKIRRETTADMLRTTRDNILGCLFMGIVLFLMRGAFPTLFVITGYVELLAFLMENYDIRDAIAHDESYRVARRNAERAAGRMIRSYLLWVVALTVLACWINSGAQWAQDFPTMQTFAVKQIELVNETLDWFKWFVEKF